MRPQFWIIYLCSITLMILSLPFVDATIEVYDYDGRKVDSFQDREAPFEDDFVVMDGFIVLADPADACSSIAGPTFLTNFTVGKFVLINGTDRCGFKLKVINADKAGYDLALIFDPTPTPFEYIRLVPFPRLEINIPVVLVSYEDGLVIKNNYLYNESNIFNYKLRIKPNIPDISYYMWLFGAVIGICFFVMLLFMMCLLIKCIQERRKSRRNRLSSRQIKQIPTTKFSKGDQYDVCAICLEDYNEGDKLRILPCSHAYHAKCIDPWLMNNRRNCPLCKRKITFGDSGDESDSEDSELTSPAENTPLLTSPLNRGQSWGTFVNPVRTMNDLDTSGPSSLPDAFQYTDNALLAANEGEATETPNTSDDETESFLPPSHGSVNNGKGNMAYLDVHTQTSVQVNFTNEGNSNGASSSQPGVPV